MAIQVDGQYRDYDPTIVAQRILAGMNPVTGKPLNLRPTFQSPYTIGGGDVPDVTTRIGQPFQLVEIVTPENGDVDSEIVAMYRIKFNDGAILLAHSEEVVADELWQPTA